MKTSKRPPRPSSKKGSKNNPQNTSPPRTVQYAKPTKHTQSSTQDTQEDLSDAEPPHASSLTALAEEALRLGRSPLPPQIPHLPGKENAIMQVGDPNVEPLDNEYSGEEIPGRDMPTPDQTNVDEIGRAYGLEDIDNGALVSPEELLERRDSNRWKTE